MVLSVLHLGLHQLGDGTRGLVLVPGWVDRVVYREIRDGAHLLLLNQLGD
jgi:hypothetical protein